MEKKAQAWKRFLPLAVFALVLMMAAGFGTTQKVNAYSMSHSNGKYIFTSSKVDYTVAEENDAGQLVYQPIGDATMDRQALNCLLNSNKKRTVVIPKGETVEIDALLRVGG